MAHPYEPKGCSGFGLRSRRRNGYGSQGLSDHAGESGPLTCEGGNKNEQNAG